jgi:hypothetical protein
MVGVAGLASADQARLFGHEPQVGLVTQATRRWDCKHALVNTGVHILSWVATGWNGSDVCLPIFGNP